MAKKKEEKGILWRELKEEELKKKIEDWRKELMFYRFKAKTGELREVHKIKETKKQIARALTELNRRKKEEYAQKTS